MLVVGARPNLIKIAPLFREIKKRDVDNILIHTGQHYDKELSDVFLSDLEIPAPDYNLNVGSGTHGYQTGNMLIKIEKVLLNEKPDIVIVSGDVNSTLAGALAAVKLHIPIAHIEAGLRSFDMNMPEEINRILVDHCSTYLFCPTKTAVMNLNKEGIPDDKIFLVGDIMLEACTQNLKIAEKKSQFKDFPLPKDFILTTVHRAENTDDVNRLSGIVDAMANSNHEIIFPVHPRTEKRLKEFNLWDVLEKADNANILKPVGYLDFLELLQKAKLVMTDSGGIQKEAFFMNKPCITLRDSTEWIETVDLGGNILVGADMKNILEGIELMMNKDMSEIKNPFEIKNTSELILDILIGDSK